MFTGLVTGLGEVVTMTRTGHELRFAIKPLFPMENIVDGESIAINGVCLSVESHSANKFIVYASGETTLKTNLNELHPGEKANLERAIAVGDRLGGHIVTGHIDCLAALTRRQMQGSSIKMRFEFPAKFSPQVVNKGSVALNGISLTINSCARSWLEVNIIPDSQNRTNILTWKVGSRINMETDLIGKYVEHMLEPWKSESAPGITDDLLMRHGFM